MDELAVYFLIFSLSKIFNHFGVKYIYRNDNIFLKINISNNDKKTPKLTGYMNNFDLKSI